MGDEAVAEPDELGTPAGPSGPAQPQSAPAPAGCGGADARGCGVVVVEEAIEGDVPQAAAKVTVVGLVPRLEVPSGDLS